MLLHQDPRSWCHGPERFRAAGPFGRCPHHRTSTPTRKVDGLPRNRLGIRDAGSLESGWKADCLGLGEVRIEAAAEGGGIHVLRLAVALTTPLQLL